MYALSMMAKMIFFQGTLLEFLVATINMTDPEAANKQLGALPWAAGQELAR